MMKINTEQRDLIRQLHRKNEEMMDFKKISYQEYLKNNQILLRRVKDSILTDEQKILLFDATSINSNLDKFRLGIKIAQLSFN
ncbi:hypothetical protein [Chryseobacterium balustinum]|uniref:hypothetical protein n=1 Tax=Chryseobacterium balustinum TaxID=246 RepID=UPI003CE7C423